MGTGHQTSDDPLSRTPTVSETLVLQRGLAIQIRPLNPGDRGAIVELYARLSRESRQRRFLTPKAELSPRELSFLTDVDHVTHEALAAVDPSDGTIVGVARYVLDPTRADVADTAIEVADDLHGRGIATELAWRLVQRAQANGFEALSATTLWENRPARALLRRLGFHARASHGSAIELELTLDRITS